MKKEISAKEFIDLINEKIKQYPAYKPGMRVYLFPTEDNPTGYSWDRKWRRMPGLVSIVVSEIRKEHILNIYLEDPF